MHLIDLGFFFVLIFFPTCKGVRLSSSGSVGPLELPPAPPLPLTGIIHVNETVPTVHPPELVPDVPISPPSTLTNTLTKLGWWDPVYVNMPDYAKQSIGRKDRRVPHYDIDGMARKATPPQHPPTKVSVLLPNGNIISVDGTLKTTPGTLLITIQHQHTDYPADKYNLAYQNLILVRDTPLEKQGVSLDIPLVLRKIPVAELELSDGTLLSLEEAPGHAVGALKHWVETTYKIPAHQQLWRYTGNELNDQETPKEQGVPLGAKVTLDRVPNISVRRVTTGEVLQFSISTRSTTEQLKRLIEKDMSIPIALQVLEFNGNVLEDHRSLEEQGVPTRAQIHLRVLPSIAVKLPEGQLVELYQVASTDTVHMVKEKLKPLAFVNPEELVCSHNNVELKESISLAAQGIQLGSTITCLKRPAVIINYNDKSYPLSIGYKSTLGYIQHAIEKETYVPVSQQQLFYNQRKISDDDADTRTLEDLKVPYASILTLERKPALFLQLSNGNKVPVPELIVGAPVSTIADVAGKALGLPLSEIILFSKGRQLEPEKPWEEQDIRLGDTLYVVEAASLTRPVTEKAAPLQVLFPGKLYQLPDVSTSDSPSVVRKAASAHSGENVKSLYSGSQELVDSGGSLAQQGVRNHAILIASVDTHGRRVARSEGEFSGHEKKPGCNVAIHGEACFTDPKMASHFVEFEKRVLWVMITYGVIIFMLALMIQSILNLLTHRVVKSRDRFVREFLETAFRTFTVVALAPAAIDIVLNFDIFEYKLEHVLFGKFDDVAPELGAAENVLKETFNTMNQIIQFFLAAYLVLVLFLAATARGFFQWLSKMDRVPLKTIVESENRTPSKALLHYASLRYEFSESVEIMTVKGLDPEFYNFMEYIRTCLLVSIVKLIRLPCTMLIIGAFSMFLIRPVSRFRHFKMLVVMLSLMAFVVLIIAFIFIRVFIIKNKLLPRNTLAYLRLRYQYGIREAPINEQELEEVGPQYKSLHVSRQTKCCTAWVRVVYGTRYPNKHEALFWLWRNGPAILERLFEAALFIGLCVIAHAFYLINSQWSVWAVEYGVWPLLAFIAMICVALASIPVTLWTLVIATTTSGLIRDDILSEVWEVQRSETVRRMAQLIDALRIEATLYDISRAGEGFMAELTQRAKAVAPHVAAENEAVFNDLDDDEDGQINLPQLYCFLTRQGLNITSEDEARKWFAVFDTDNSGGIDRAEFDVVISVAKQLTGDTLDVTSVNNLLVTKFKFDPDDQEAVSVPRLAKLMKTLHIQRSWNYNRFVHLIEFISGRRGQRTLSVTQLTEGLKRVEQETIGTLTQAVGELKAWKPGSGSAVDKFTAVP